MKIVLLLCLSIVLCGCEEQRFWRIDQMPLTEAERKAVADQEARILAGTPHTLSGHDQDWDDAIAAAHKAAIESCCEPRLFEVLEYGIKTGNWKPLPAASR